MQLRRIRTVLVAAAMVVPAVGAVPEAAAGGPLVGPFVTTGAQIVDQGTGQPVVFRGAVYDGPEKAVGYPPHVYFPGSALEHMQAWGANMVRIPLSEDLWNAAVQLTDPTNAGGPRQVCPGEVYDTGYVDQVQQVVSHANADGLMVILELNFTNPGCASATTGGTWLPLPGPGALTFWRDVATLFKGDPLVAFELYNEPSVCSVNGTVRGASSKTGCGAYTPAGEEANTQAWAKGGSMTTGTTTYDGQGMDDLYDAIRSTGAPNLVIADANVLSGDARGFSTDAYVASDIGRGTDVVLAGHLYPGSESCAFVKSTVDWYDYWATSRITRPVMWDEFGWPQPDETTVPTGMQFMLDEFAAHGQGWAAFAWTVESPNYNSQWALLKSDTIGPGDATATGQAVKDALAGVYHGNCSPGVPGAATITGVDPVNQGAVIHWTPPADASSDAPVYTVTYSDGSTTRTATTRCEDAYLNSLAPAPWHCDPWTLTGLTNGTTYTVSMTLDNGYGVSPVSNAVTVTAADLPPAAPTNVTAAAGNQTTSPPTYNPAAPTITVTWQPPADNGGSPVTGYVVYSQRNTGNGYGTQYTSPVLPATARSYVAPFATTDVKSTYRMVVVAVNAAGTGAGGVPPQTSWNLTPS